MAGSNLSSWISGNASAILLSLSLITYHASFSLIGYFCLTTFFFLLSFVSSGTCCIGSAKWVGVIQGLFIFHFLFWISGKGWADGHRHFWGTKYFLWEKVTNLLGFCREDGGFSFSPSGLLFVSVMTRNDLPTLYSQS